jgi:hypothetical protein
MEESFDLAIKDHLELKRRNRLLEGQMPLAAYRDGGVARHAVVLEDTQEWVMPESPAVLEHEPLFPAPEDLWTGAPVFDWGD